jgi:hypothetical protein
MGYARVSTKIWDPGSDARRLAEKDQEITKATYPLKLPQGGSNPVRQACTTVHIP